MALRHVRLSTTLVSLGLLVLTLTSLLSSMYFASHVVRSNDAAGYLQRSRIDPRISDSAAHLYTEKLQALRQENQRLRRQLQQQQKQQQQQSPTHPSTPTQNHTSACHAASARLTRSRTPGLSADSLRRSRAHVGHPYRWAQLARTLRSGNRPIHVVAFGGSITAAHGVERNLTHVGSEGYPRLLEHWLNDALPLAGGAERHRVHVMAQHGADICSLAKRINGMLQYLHETKDMPEQPDMIILEYAVNDYQGQDHVHHTISQLDVFFQNFEELALCAEVVVNSLLRRFPDTVVLFLEFRTAILQRKTAQMLHTGVAQHYGVPVLSYGDAVLPEFFELVYHRLNASDLYTVPADGNDTVLPYPYGCHDCWPEAIIDQFRDSFNPAGIKHCRTVCDIMVYANYPCDNVEPPPPGRRYCYPAIFAVDAVHPSAVGHAIAKDILLHAVATAIHDECERTEEGATDSIRPHVLPPEGWLGTPQALMARSDFVLVQDADCLSDFCLELLPSYKTAGFSLYSDTSGFKLGWIATNETGGEILEFTIDLPERPCYVIYLAILRSYWEGMGKVQVSVTDLQTKTKTSVELDSLWESRISVWSDNQITSDETPACTGKCLVRVTTLPQVSGRIGNKAKILTLSVRECIKL